MSDATILRFGAFELRTAPAELRLNGDPVKLPPQPLKVLELLARRSGEVLTRNEIRDHVWCGDTFVDFEQGLNFCIRQIREALGDHADAPRFVETLPRRGYRFLMPVTEASTRQPVQVTRLIVLPFRVLREDPDTDFLAFSLPDALTLSLSGLTSLVVRSSMAAARFGGAADADPKTIAAEADVDVIVTGALLRAGDQVRVTSQLTEASTGTLLWSATAQAPVGDLFQVQDELARRIVESLKLPLTRQDQRLMQGDVPSSAKAYDYYLRGNRLSQDSKQWAVARDLYLRSVEEDPQYAPAWARLGRIHHVMAKYLPTGATSGLDLAEQAFRKALELNPDLPLTHKLYAQLDVERGMARGRDGAPNPAGANVGSRAPRRPRDDVPLLWSARRVGGRARTCDQPRAEAQNQHHSYLGISGCPRPRRDVQAGTIPVPRGVVNGAARPQNRGARGTAGD
jgi:DNA-binding winged helix-turn-helix (wHTH) protein